MARHFYITFATHAEHWSGHLTIGQHYYWWTSADVGDAHLLDPAACATLEAAIVALKAEMAHLCRALSTVSVGAVSWLARGAPRVHGVHNWSTVKSEGADRVP